MWFEQHPRQRLIHVAIILAFAYVFFFHALGTYSLKEPDEGRYAEIPREMVEQGDWIVPHLNYLRYFEKPPLLYWVNAVSLKVLGTHEWSARLPNALAALGCVLVTYLFMARWVSPGAGLLAALILTTSIGFFSMAHIVTTDMLLTFLLTLSVFSFYEFYRARSPSYLYLFYGSLALATLTKGPVAVLLVAVSVCIYLATERNLAFLGKILTARGLALYGLIAIPWFVAISLREPEFPYFFFIDQHLLRFLTSKHRRSGPIYYFIPFVVGGMLPWSIFLPTALVNAWRDKGLRFLIVWSAVVFAFFSLSGSKLPPYVLPMFPALSVFLAALFHDRWQKAVPATREVLAYALFFGGVTAAAIVGMFFVPPQYLEPVHAFLQTCTHPQALVWAFIGLCAAPVFLLCFRIVRRFAGMFCLLTGFSVVFFLLLMTQMPALDGYKTAKGFAQIINREGPEAIVIDYESYDQTLPFYIGRHVFLASYLGELVMGAKYADARWLFLNDEAVREKLRSGKKVFVVMREKSMPSVQQKIDGLHLVTCTGGRCLLSNFPPTENVGRDGLHKKKRN
jgi:4-amino-4-deoxy-L-arabinose transferase-like glycosyltransferase